MEDVSTHFIHSFKNSLLADVNIYVVSCEFNIENYRDDWFERLNIHFPESKVSSLKKRKAEFLAGRYAAREALKVAGVDSSVVIRSDKNGCPIWPESITGSITHKKNTAMCAVSYTQEYLSLGIDLEERLCNKIAENIWQSVLSESELDVISELNMTFSEVVTLAFSAKESVFKAVYPLIKRYVDFSFVKIVRVDKENNLVWLRTDYKVGDIYKAGIQLAVKWRMDSRFIFTLVFIEN